MLTQALAASTDMYKENSRILSLLDDKAQKTAGLAGIFLAAAFAFLRKDSLETLISIEGTAGIVLLTFSLGLLVVCVFIGGLVLWAQKLRTPPDPNKILHTCDLLLKREGGPTDEQRENHIRDQIRSWNLALQVQDKVIETKSKRLLAMQWALVIAMTAVAAMLAYPIAALKFK